MDFIKTFDVSINTTGKGILRDKNKCTHCGSCLTHCRPHALHITDTHTREVVFDETKCIECQACIKVCPYDACASAF
ncbi:MAG: 4Fe-4S binding protein [Fibrobacteria bacterium]|nr:4Fe-4S binding protein [Fibrobacteria bacterium]